MMLRIWTLGVLVCLSVTAHATQELEIPAPKDWRSEAISLPPGFAPQLQLSGEALLRFSPGMFDKDSEQFFTYAFAFRTAQTPDLTTEILKRELLAYYQGLATAIAKSRGADPKTETFKILIEPAKKIAGEPGITHLTAKLTWIEPFATGTKQNLHLDICTWKNEATKKNLMLVCASSKTPDTKAVWDVLRKIQSDALKTLRTKT